MRRIFDISKHVATYGEYVDFYLKESPDYFEGLEVPPENFSKVVKLAAVYPNDAESLKIDGFGIDIEGSMKVFTQAYFPISNEDENPTDTRMVYNSKAYRLITRKRWTMDYYVYLAELLRVDPDVSD